MISFKQKGDFSKLNLYLERVKQAVKLSELDRFGREGVNALASATPVNSGLTASSWEYNIERNSTGAAIQFYNTNVNEGVNIAIILQYGHATKNGGWVEGRDYINPAIRPVFDKLAEEAWKEVTRV